MKGFAKTHLAALAALVFLVASAGLATSSGKGSALELYTATVDARQMQQLAQEGYDVVAPRQKAEGIRVGLVLSDQEAERLRGQGLALGVWRNRDGKTQSQLAAEQAAGGFEVWKPYDGPGGIHELLYDIAQRNRRLVKLEVIGMTLGTDPEGDDPAQPREIVALKVTRDANRTPDGAGPAVLYTALQHAREWITGEMTLRLLDHVLDNYGSDPEVTNLVNTRELWFVPVANPDGYQYTHDVERLWRKNLRDNDGDNQITNFDGVDPNRNFPEHWNYDNEGSASQPSDQTYRGTAPGSEPETQAMITVLNRAQPEFQVNYHSFGGWLLLPLGWAEGIITPDNPIFSAWAGTDTDPAVQFTGVPFADIGQSADELYITNGETTDYAYSNHATLAMTPEMGQGEPGNGFVFTDDEALVQQEFDGNVEFALDAARSAPDPANPVSHLGRTTEPFYLHQDQLDPQFHYYDDFRFDVSYGDPQPVRVLARRDLDNDGDSDPVTLQYRINGGPVQSGPTTEWTGGDRFGGGGVYYHIMQGQVTGTSPGDTVEVWFTGAGEDSESFTYAAEVESSNDVLVMAAEDYTGRSPIYKKTDGPNFLQHYLDALAANGIGADVYDIDAHGRKAPRHLGVLGHYEAVIWYTGDDIITREAGMVPGTASRLAYDEMLSVRSYLNEGGNVLYTGKFAGFQHAFFFEFDPAFNRACNPNTADDFGAGQEGCRQLYDDFLQYYLGAFFYNDGAGSNAQGHTLDVLGADTPFTDTSWSFGGPSANNQDHSASFLATSGILPEADYPQFASWPSAKYDRAGGPFEPHTGTKYMYSQIGDISYKRLTRAIDVPAGGANLDFWVSHDTEFPWDFFFVEAHTLDASPDDDWTTLPDQNGHTTQNTGDSCPAGWIEELHPFLAHYQTHNPDGTCSPVGTTGAWNASTGNSAGWQNWSIDLSAYAGTTVEVSLGYASDWSVQGLGVFLDDITASTGAGTTSFEDDADPMDGWAVTGPPPGSSPNPNNFIRTDATGFPEGAVITSDPGDADFRTLYMGFGFEGIAGPATRATVMDKAMDYLLGP